MSTIRPATLTDTVKLMLLGGIWGSSFMCIEIALTGFPPLTLAATRILLAALTLNGVVWLTGQRWSRGAGTWGLLIIVGLFSSALPFILVSWGQQFISSGLSAIVIATGSFVSLFLSHLLTPDDQLTVPKISGMAIGFSGVVVLVGVDALAGLDETVLGQLAVMGAATCYAISGIITRKTDYVPPLVNSAVVLLTAACYMVPLALIIDGVPHPVPDLKPILALGFLGLVPTALAYLLRFQLIQQVGVVFISQVSYLVPLFAVFWGWLFLAEVPSPSAWVALGMILVGINVSRLRPRD